MTEYSQLYWYAKQHYNEDHWYGDLQHVIADRCGIPASKISKIDMVRTLAPLILNEINDRYLFVDFLLNLTPEHNYMVVEPDDSTIDTIIIDCLHRMMQHVSMDGDTCLLDDKNTDLFDNLPR